MTSFKNIFLGIFIVIFIFAILVFADVIKIGKSSTQEAQVTVTIWGPFSEDALKNFLIDYNSANPNTQITYVQVPSDNLHERLVEAIASGSGPDMVIFSNENFLQDVSKLYVTPYTAYTERTFQDTYTEGSRIFLKSDGVILYPLVVDPLVVYYNKDLLAGAKFIYPPRSWSALNQAVPLFLKKDKTGITTSAIALGESLNMPYFKRILSTLLLQSGSPVMSFNSMSKTYVASLSAPKIAGDALNSQEQAFLYYQSFSDPTNPLYSWNKKLPNAQDSFVSGNTAFYIAPASELFDIQTKNPNLNFDVTPMFQPDNAVRPLTYGTIYGIGIIKSSPNIASAFALLSGITSSATVDAISKQVSLPPARRDLLAVQPTDPYAAVFFDQALHAFSWPDPDKEGTDNAFRDMIRKQASGEWSVGEALYETQNKIQSYIR